MKTISIPRLQKLTSQTELSQYGATYFQCSGLAVPAAYLDSASNRVYGIRYNKEMIGGFVLGQGETLRTLEVFAQPDARHRLYHELGSASACTEITCFWIAPGFRRNTALNTFVWLCLGFTLSRFGASQVIFGTCSASLAKLYSATPRALLIHRDVVNGKNTFIFRGDRQVSWQAFAEILRYKWARLAHIRIHRTSQVRV
ncbi:MAG: hypothetical protein OHK0039_05590 [Bacteroidia bacterium]